MGSSVAPVDTGINGCNSTRDEGDRKLCGLFRGEVPLRRVLFDSDVLIDVLSQRQPFAMASTLALDAVEQPGIEGWIAAHAVTNIFYILRRQVGVERTRELLTHLLLRLQVASVTDAVIRQALSSAMTDFEDAVMGAAAVAASMDVIVTRNVSDYGNLVVPVMLPEAFLVTLSAQE